MVTIRKSSSKDAEIAIAMGMIILFFSVVDSQRLNLPHRFGMLSMLKF